jgi:hypothetical protein
MKRKTRNNPWYKAQELIARLEGGELTPASGAIPAHKGDVRNQDAVYEVKYSKKSSFYLSFNVLRKAIDEALLAAGRDPAVYIVMQKYGVFKIIPIWADTCPSFSYCYSIQIESERAIMGITLEAWCWDKTSEKLPLLINDGADKWVGWKIAEAADIGYIK